VEAETVSTDWRFAEVVGAEIVDARIVGAGLLVSSRRRENSTLVNLSPPVIFSDFSPIYLESVVNLFVADFWYWLAQFPLFWC